MTRINLFLFAVLVAAALSLVSSQHKERKLYVELQRQTDESKRLDVEWGQLQLEQSTLAMSALIEKVATGRLQMRVPGADRIQTVSLADKGAP